MKSTRFTAIVGLAAIALLVTAANASTGPPAPSEIPKIVDVQTDQVDLDVGSAHVEAAGYLIICAVIPSDPSGSSGFRVIFEIDAMTDPGADNLMAIENDVSPLAREQTDEGATNDVAYLVKTSDPSGSSGVAILTNGVATVSTDEYVNQPIAVPNRSLIDDLRALAGHPSGGTSPSLGERTRPMNTVANAVYLNWAPEALQRI